MNIIELGHTYAEDAPPCYLKSPRSYKETKRIILYVQFMIDELITLSLAYDLGIEAVSDLLVEFYGYEKMTDQEFNNVDSTENDVYDYIDLYENIEIGGQSGQKLKLLADRKLFRPDLEQRIWQKYEQFRQDLISPGKEIPEVHLLTQINFNHSAIEMKVSDYEDNPRGPKVTIRGLNDQILSTLREFFPEASVNPYCIEFPLNRYPLKEYSFEWDGQQILITYKWKWQIRIKSETNIIKDIDYPITSPYKLRNVLIDLGYK